MSRLYPRNRDLSEPIESIELRVERRDEGRFDAYVARKLPWRSRGGAQRLIEEGSALVNGERRKPSTRLRAGDVVRIDVRRAEAPAPLPAPAVHVLYEDGDMFAVDKEAGVVVHPVGTYQQGTLLQELHRRNREGPLPQLIHRIDQHTSGVLLVARRDDVRAAFSDMLERGEVGKSYDAILLGRVTWDEKRVDAPLAPVGDSRILQCVDREHGKPARSHFRVRERFAHATHVAVDIETGRTHQIRVHAALLGHPLVGDHLYGDGLPVGAFERFALHARTVRFVHPFTGAALAIEAPLPAPFLKALDLLRAAPAGDAS